MQFEKVSIDFIEFTWILRLLTFDLKNEYFRLWRRIFFWLFVIEILEWWSQLQTRLLLLFFLNLYYFHFDDLLLFRLMRDSKLSHLGRRRLIRKLIWAIPHQLSWTTYCFYTWIVIRLLNLYLFFLFFLLEQPCWNSVHILDFLGNLLNDNACFEPPT